jgi:hypothetical protein
MKAFMQQLDSSVIGMTISTYVRVSVTKYTKAAAPSVT